LDGPAAPPVIKAGKNESKINKICNAFLATLQPRIETNLQNLITAHVCKSPPDMEAGLALAAGLRSKLLIPLSSFKIEYWLTARQRKILSEPKTPLSTCVS
jgi:hypothetical protein